LPDVEELGQGLAELLAVVGPSGWSMMLSQWLEMHLKRQSDLAGTRERISTRMSSVSRSTAVPLVGVEDDLHKQSSREGGEVRGSVKKGDHNLWG
jgi:hypothetical protein